ncbi:hypothetical protein D3C83_26070 [compost metagenome]
MRDGADRRQRLTAEAEGRDTDEILCRTDLRRGMALQREQRLIARHPDPVVTHANALAAAVLGEHIDGDRAGVERVLDQLLHHRRRPFDHFTRRDLIGDRARQNRDPRCRLGTGGHSQ